MAGRDSMGKAMLAYVSRCPLVSVSTKLAKSRRVSLAWMYVLESAKMANHKRESFVYRCKGERPPTSIPETFPCLSFESRGSRLKMAALLFMGTLRLMPSGMWRKKQSPLSSGLWSELTMKMGISDAKHPWEGCREWKWASLLLYNAHFSPLQWKQASLFPAGTFTL